MRPDALPASLRERLHPDDVEAIAQRVAQLVHPADDYLTVDDFCKRFSVGRSTVYEHADELGAIRIGGALRLPARIAVSGSAEPNTAPVALNSRRRRPARVDLLPISDRRAA